MVKNNPDIFVFGEVLVDCFPDGKQVLGGAPFNVAWHCQALGLQPILISRLGNDGAGDQIITAMQEWGMSIEAIQYDTDHPTGKVEVSFNQGEPQYEIVTDSAWDFIDAGQLPHLPEGCLLYHGSLVFRQAVSQQCLDKLLKSDCHRFVDVNLRDPWWTKTMIKTLLAGAQWVKLNHQEQRALALQAMSGELILTAGEDGAEWISKQGERWVVAPEHDMPVVDTVGAGDAFCSVVLLGLYHQWPIEQILARAQAFASAVVGIRGAISRDAGFYQPFIEQWDLS
jgi:fructokinase